MKWFPGSINEAVATSKSRKAIFVVFVAGTDELSIEATKAIDTPEISSSLEKDDFVAIRLESGSESYRFFAQIYQLVPVPSLFFIGENGKPLEIIAGNITTSNLVSKIESVLSKAGKKVSSGNFIKAEQSNAAATSSSHSSISNVAPVNEPSASKTPETVAQQPAVDASQINTEKIKDDSPPKVTEASSSSSETVQIADKNDDKGENSSPEEKVERARKLIELQKQQRIEQEREKEKLREKERREIGRQMQNSRRQQQDLEMKIAHEERKKEKAAELEARERIRQQIAQDKLERKQREQALLQQTTQQQQQYNQERPNAPVVFPGDGNARIQFRLPSGNPHTATFEAISTLRELRAYVVSNIDLPFRQFSLSMSFPRRDLNEEDDEKTLFELQLVPTAVILILPIKNVRSTSVVAAEDSSFLSRFMWALFAPILTVYNYLSGLLFGTQTRDTNQQNDSNSSNDPPARAGGVYATSSHSNSSANQSTGAIRQNLGGTSATVRARGNVHRLHSGGEDNDENNTWNGNSTQQM